MISLEIENNLSHLKGFMDTVNSRMTFPKESGLYGVQKLDGFKQYGFQPWKRRVWDSLTTSIPLALNPGRINEVDRLYNKLDELTLLKESRMHFDSESEWADAFEKRINDLLETGNPLSRRKLLFARQNTKELESK